MKSAVAFARDVFPLGRVAAVVATHLVPLMTKCGKGPVRLLLDNSHRGSAFCAGGWRWASSSGFSGFQHRNAGFEFCKPLRQTDEAFPDRYLFEDFGYV